MGRRFLGHVGVLIALSFIGCSGSPTEPSDGATEDATVTEIMVEGQGSIPKNGTINIPQSGVNFRFRGIYQSLRFPWPIRHLFSVSILTDGRAFGSASYPPSSEPSNPFEWEYSIRNWRPCIREIDGFVFCYPASDTLSIAMQIWEPGRMPISVRKRQSWPLVFRLMPGCCELPGPFLTHPMSEP